MALDWRRWVLPQGDDLAASTAVGRAQIVIPPAEPAQSEILALACLTCFVFVASVCALASFPVVVDNFGDSSSYMSVASAIRHWDFHGLIVKQFWGLPYVMAAVSSVTHMSDRVSLLLVCWLTSFIALALACRLWGGWVAAFFAVLNFDWMQRSFLGGAEPLFVALLFGTFLAVRREKWGLAALLGSFSTVVRPLGVLALAALGITLLGKRKIREMAVAILTSLVVGGLYILPFRIYFSNSLANVNRYQQADWAGGHLLAAPFYAITKGTLLYPQPWTNLALTFGWIFLVLAGVLAMLGSNGFREYGRKRPTEVIFAVSYLVFLYTYNAPYWARGTFPRFAIPIIPFVVLALLPQIPKSRPLLWVLAFVSPVLAACSAVGIRNLLHLMIKPLVLLISQV
jgi:hypothetical protein